MNTAILFFKSIQAELRYEVWLQMELSSPINFFFFIFQLFCICITDSITNEDGFGLLCSKKQNLHIIKIITLKFMSAGRTVERVTQNTVFHLEKVESGFKRCILDCLSVYILLDTI